MQQQTPESDIALWLREVSVTQGKLHQYCSAKAVWGSSCCTQATFNQHSDSYFWSMTLRNRSKFIKNQVQLTGILSVRLSFQTSKSATTISLSSVRDNTPSRSMSKTLKQTERKGNYFSVLKLLDNSFFFLVECKSAESQEEDLVLTVLMRQDACVVVRKRSSCV